MEDGLLCRITLFNIAHWTAIPAKQLAAIGVASWNME
jgi:hypothetical protein